MFSDRRSDNLIALSLVAFAGLVLLLSSGGMAKEYESGSPTVGPAPESGMASATAVIADLKKINPACPPPTVSKGSQCVLQEDTDLSSIGTLDISSFTKLNCQGHRIYTSHPGSNITDRSMPEVGIVIREAYGVKIQNCVIDGFDFGILALDSKVPEGMENDPGAMELLGNDILNNTIDGRYVPVGLVSVDNTRIKKNDISVKTDGGVGVLVLRDSDGNRIANNEISIDPNNDTSGAVKLPGPVTNLNPSNPGPGAVFISQGSGLPNLINVVIGDTLYQFPASDSTYPDESASEDNILEGNTITATRNRNDVSVSNSQRTVISGNDLKSARIAVLFGGAGFNETQQFPGRCTNDSSRLCLADSNCFIPGFDGSSKGSCANVTSKTLFWISDGAVIKDNRITGPLNKGMLVSTPNALIQGNNITGPMFNNTAFTLEDGSGIELRRFAIESATVTRNTVSDFPAPLRLFSNPVFGARISLNDFTDYADEVLTRGYVVPSELSVDGKGNYWGLSCQPPNYGFDPNKVLDVQTAMVQADGTIAITGTPNPYIVDSHPFGEPVAATTEDSLPAVCK